MKRAFGQAVRLRGTGGLVPIPILRELADLARSHGDGTLQVTSRQDIVCRGIAPGVLGRFPAVAQAAEAGEDRVSPQTAPSVVTTAPSVLVGPGTPWLTDGTFREVIATFDPPPQIPVALCDPGQNFLPCGAGLIAFVATEIYGYWQLAVAGASGGIRIGPHAYPSEKLAGLVSAIPIEPMPDSASIFRIVDRNSSGTGIATPGAAAMPRPAAWSTAQIVQVPGSDTLSIAAHSPGGRFTGDFVEELCRRAQPLGQAHIGVTPTRGFVVGGIAASEAQTWRWFLARHTIRSRDSEFWATATVADHAGAEALAHQVSRALDDARIDLAGIRLGIGSTHGVFSDDLRIEARPARYGREKFTIWKCAGLGNTLNSGESERTYSLAGAIHALIGEIRSVHADRGSAPEPAGTGSAVPPFPRDFSCRECGTHYSAEYGDPIGGVEPGVDFDLLGSEWSCPVCGAGKAAFSCTTMEATL